jgi:CHAT domain-containing protein
MALDDTCLSAQSSSIGVARTKFSLKETGTVAWPDSVWRSLRRRRFQLAFVIGLFLLIPIEDSRIVDAQAEYNYVRRSFLRGQLQDSQHQAEEDYLGFRSRNPEWASKFQLLEAEIMVRRGLYDDAIALLSSFHASANDQEDTIQQLTLESLALEHQQQVPQAKQKIVEAEALCRDAGYSACGNVLRARGVLAVSEGNLVEARQLLLETLAFAQAHQDRFLEASAALDLGWQAIQVEHYDEAVDWSRIAYNTSAQLGAEDLAENSSGNLGWAYFRLGDTERALDLFLNAQKTAGEIGNTRSELGWMTTVGYAHQQNGDLTDAAGAYYQALALARRINSKEDIVDLLEDLAHLSIETGNLDQADKYLAQLLPLVRATENRLDDLDVTLAQGEIAAARHQDQQAETIFKAVVADPSSQTSMRLGAQHRLANLYESRRDPAEAERMYQAALTTFEGARQQLTKEDSKLPFLANATPIYTDYIGFLIKQGKVQQALDVADHSRARTLEQGLGVAAYEGSFHPDALNLGSIARKANATLLFYWLGRSQSYLWAVTPTRTALFTLPARDQIAATVRRYRNTLLGLDGSLEASSTDGTALYRMLVAPAKALIPAGSNVVVLSDGALSELNFETLIVPSATPHYWIEDATIISAPSLYMLAMAKPDGNPSRRLLLLGNAVSLDPDYPKLPQAALEMQHIEKHFAAGDTTVLAQLQANPESYLDSSPQQYSYIHFVAHGVASLTDPLDSAIILSPAGDTEDSFKLYARDIIRHPIHARLVTISSCYGGGTRSYAGEGLVGLSWAFLRAGAHNVIGALWEVSDDSTPQLMDTLYRRLEEGAPPSVALRQAKLALIHAQGNFRNPFYWAPFQIYTGL